MHDCISVASHTTRSGSAADIKKSGRCDVAGWKLGRCSGFCLGTALDSGHGRTFFHRISFDKEIQQSLSLSYVNVRSSPKGITKSRYTLCVQASEVVDGFRVVARLAVVVAPSPLLSFGGLVAAASRSLVNQHTTIPLWLTILSKVASVGCRV